MAVVDRVLFRTCAACALLLVAAPSFGQTSNPLTVSIQSVAPSCSSPAVTVVVSVTFQGSPLSILQQSQFTVDENGSPLPISSFTATPNGVYTLVYSSPQISPFVGVGVAVAYSDFGATAFSSYTTCVTVSCNNPPNATPNIPYGHTLKYSPTTLPAPLWSLQSDSSGQLTIDPATGEIRGTFTSPGTVNFIAETTFPTFNFAAAGTVRPRRAVAACSIVVAGARITQVSPAFATACGPSFDVIINGSSFLGEPTVNFSSKSAGIDAQLKVKSAAVDRIVATVPEALIAKPASDYVITVTLETSSGGTSTTEPLPFTVNAAPSISGVSPSTASVGASNFALTVTGTNFVPGRTILIWNAGTFTPQQLNPSSVTATQMVVPVSASLLTAGTVTVAALNVEAANNTQTLYKEGCSARKTITIGTPGPTITLLTPNAATACGPQFGLTIAGTNLLAGASAFWDSIAVPGATVANSLVSAQITPGLIGTTPRTVKVSVANPAVGGVTGTPTSPLDFVIGPAPSISDVSPKFATGTGPQTVTVTGTNFAAGKTRLRWTSGTTTQVFDTTVTSPANLTASVPASVLVNGAQVAVVIADLANPNASAGQTTGCPQPFTVVTPAGSITTLAPSSEFVGLTTALPITVNGSGFINGAQVLVNGTALTTTFVTAQQLTATLPANLFTSAGTLQITVRNPGAVATAPAPFQVLAVPAQPYSITASAPSTAPPGSDVSLTLQQATASPRPLDATLTVSFEPNADNVPASGLPLASQPVFGNGTQTFTFTIQPPGTTTALPAAGMVKTPTVAGTIVVRLTNLVVSGTTQVVLPAPAPEIRIIVARSRPAIDTSVPVRIINATGGLDVELVACSTPRNVRTGNYVFEVAPGTTVEGSLTVPVDLQSAFATWFASSAGLANGGCFRLRVPFLIANGDASAITAVTVTLTNSEGDSNSVRGTR